MILCGHGGSTRTQNLEDYLVDLVVIILCSCADDIVVGVEFLKYVHFSFLSIDVEFLVQFFDYVMLDFTFDSG